LQFVVPSEGNIVYYEVADSDIEKAFSLAAGLTRNTGVDLSIPAFLEKNSI